MFFFDPKNCSCPMIAAHRGYRGIRPENTRCAFDASLGRCHYIELDVQMSRDGILVVHHDDDLGRTCNVDEVPEYTGMSRRIEDWNFEDLQKLDYGSWFLKKDPFATLADGKVQRTELLPMMPQKILTLKELLGWRNRVDIALNIEIKDQLGGRHDLAIVDALLTEILAANCAEKLIISSFNHRYIKEISKKKTGLMLGLLQENENPDDLCAYLQAHGACAYHPDKSLVTKELLQELRRKGYAINIYTVNDVEQQRQLLRDGATSVISDFPDLTVVDF